MIDSNIKTLIASQSDWTDDEFARIKVYVAQLKDDEDYLEVWDRTCMGRNLRNLQKLHREFGPRILVAVRNVRCGL